MVKKKSKKSEVINRNKAQYSDSLTKTIKILCILVIMFVIIYIGTAFVRGELKAKDSSKNNDVTIQYDEILAGSTFKMSDSEYMVLYYDYEAKDAGLYGILYDSYSQKGSAVKMYKVNLASGFNKSYVTEGKVKTNPTSSDDLKLKSPTLIRIKNKKVIKFISSKDDIKKYVNSL